MFVQGLGYITLLVVSLVIFCISSITGIIIAKSKLERNALYFYVPLIFFSLGLIGIGVRNDSITIVAYGFILSAVGFGLLLGLIPRIIKKVIRNSK